MGQVINNNLLHKLLIYSAGWLVTVETVIRGQKLMIKIYFKTLPELNQKILKMVISNLRARKIYFTRIEVPPTFSSMYFSFPFDAP